jgi:hypothetical protein
MNEAQGLMRIPEDWVPFAVVALGGAMLMILMVLHGFGLDRIVTGYQRGAERMKSRGRRPSVAVLGFAMTILLMLILHMVELWIWGALLWAGGLVKDLHVAMYFAANAYTTLGMGNMALPHTWHELSPMIAISGLFAFAWTTSELFNIVGDQHDLMKELSKERKHTD